METSSINTNNSIPNINTVNQNSASNVGAPLKNSANTPPIGTDNILESSLVLSKGELAQNLKKVNDGIMITSLANKGLEKQTEILNNIKSELTQKVQDYKIDIDKNQLKQDVLSELDDFNKIAKDLKYDNKSLLDSDENKTIEINTMSQTVDLNIPSTKELGSDVAGYINRTDLTEENLDSIVNKLDDSLEKMNKYREEFTQTQRLLVESAKNTIQEQTRESMTKSEIQNRNYSTEAAEFSKANVNAMAGHLVAAQANIPQSHGMRLLY